MLRSSATLIPQIRSVSTNYLPTCSAAKKPTLFQSHSVFRSFSSTKPSFGFGGKGKTKYNDPSVNHEVNAIQLGYKGEFEKIEAILEKVKKPSIKIYNSLIRAYIKRHCLGKIALVLEKLDEPEQPDPDDDTFLPLIIEYITYGYEDKAFEVMNKAAEYSAISYPSLRKIINLYMEKDMINEALQIIRALEISGFFSEELYDYLFKEMSKFGGTSYDSFKRYLVYFREITHTPLKKEYIEYLLYASLNSGEKFDCFHIMEHLIDKYTYCEHNIPTNVLRHLLDLNHTEPELKLTDKIKRTFYRGVARGFRFNDDSVNETLLNFYNKGDFENTFNTYEIMKRDVYNIFTEVYVPITKSALSLGTEDSLNHLPELIMASNIPDEYRVGLLQALIENETGPGRQRSAAPQIDKISQYLKNSAPGYYTEKINEVLMDYYFAIGDRDKSLELVVMTLTRFNTQKTRDSSLLNSSLELKNKVQQDIERLQTGHSGSKNMQMSYPSVSPLSDSEHYGPMKDNEPYINEDSVDKLYLEANIRRMCGTDEEEDKSSGFGQLKKEPNSRVTGGLNTNPNGEDTEDAIENFSLGNTRSAPKQKTTTGYSYESKDNSMYKISDEKDAPFDSLQASNYILPDTYGSFEYKTKNIREEDIPYAQADLGNLPSDSETGIDTKYMKSLVSDLERNEEKSPEGEARRNLDLLKNHSYLSDSESIDLFSYDNSDLENTTINEKFPENESNLDKNGEEVKLTESDVERINLNDSDLEQIASAQLASEIQSEGSLTSITDIEDSDFTGNEENNDDDEEEESEDYLSENNLASEEEGNSSGRESDLPQIPIRTVLNPNNDYRPDVENWIMRGKKESDFYSETGSDSEKRVALHCEAPYFNFSGDDEDVSPFISRGQKYHLPNPGQGTVDPQCYQRDPVFSGPRASSKLNRNLQKESVKAITGLENLSNNSRVDSHEYKDLLENIPNHKSTESIANKRFKRNDPEYDEMYGNDTTPFRTDSINKVERRNQFSDDKEERIERIWENVIRYHVSNEGVQSAMNFVETVMIETDGIVEPPSHKLCAEFKIPTEWREKYDK